VIMDNGGPVLPALKSRVLDFIMGSIGVVTHGISHLVPIVVLWLLDNLVAAYVSQAEERKLQAACREVEIVLLIQSVRRWVILRIDHTSN
jgi:hypothetical protein